MGCNYKMKFYRCLVLLLDVAKHSKTSFVFILFVLSFRKISLHFSVTKVCIIVMSVVVELSVNHRCC